MSRDIDWGDWPKCAVPACQNRCCLRLRSKYCWPHTPGSPLEAQQNLLETEMRPQEKRAAPTKDAA